ncbi:MAG: 3-oxoacyl-[acyl-carrier-protein] reductase [Candidatus Cloacimonetes bacterium]|nr:3-oxoacyl-[acyl-carrier-protein] reductase [Candidatus Cloacimonadota bacterium]MBS3766526.1 3-oxoacyl-[acyl-carrier-protein] reductase [Candidatus Cloacimonadota bacterium]
MKNLLEKVAIVTGAARGIGKSIAQALLELGAQVIIIDLNQEEIDKTVEELTKVNENIFGYVCDITSIKTVGKMVKSISKDFGSIDILINNAGITSDKLLIRMKQSDWQKVIDVNLTGTYNCTQKISRIMMKQRSGKIVNISSIIGIMGNAGQANYAASKGGIIAFTKSVAKELAPRGINVNAIAPGFIKTKMTDKLSDGVKEEYLAQIPMKKFGTPSEVADLAIFLCSKNSEYITGQTIAIDGGMV